MAKAENAGGALKHGLFLLLEKLLRWSINPRLRARLLAAFGAQIGRNVRIYEIQLFNLQAGFSNLHLAEDVHIGPGCRIDLTASLTIAARSTLSPGVTVLTHSDPGSAHGSKLLTRYPARISPVRIGSDCWIGANAILLGDVTLGDLVVVAAGSVVTQDLPSGSVAAGVPAEVKKMLAEPAA